MFRRSQRAARTRRAATRRGRQIGRRKLRFEPLEERRLLAVLTVNSIEDNLTAGDQLVTLREAIKAANTNTATDLGQTGSGADTIQFAWSVFGGTIDATIQLQLGELELTEAATIDGPGDDLLTIDAQELSRIFNISATLGDFTIDGLTLTNGKTTGDANGGGAILSQSSGNLFITDCIVINSFTEGANSHGGGIAVMGNTTLTNSVVAGNHTKTFAFGGGIFVNGQIRLIDSTVSGNHTELDFGFGGGIAVFGAGELIRSSVMDNHTTGINAHGGGIVVQGTITISNSTVSGNHTDGEGSHGGGIHVNGSINMTESTVDNNRTMGANSDGGGIFLSGTTSSVLNSTISRNSATRNGGGMYSDTDPDDPAAISNSTFSGNTAGGFGGGLYNIEGLAVLEFNTFTRNTAPADMGSGVASRGEPDTVTRVRSSIIAANTNSDVDFVNGQTNTFVSLGYNLLGTGNALGVFNNNDQTNKVPNLFPLANNGGPTKTHMPMPGSVAIDTGIPGLFPGVNGIPVYDQRGNPFLRIQDGDGNGMERMDVGATEAENPNNGLRVSGVYVTHNEAYPLFDPKPSTDGPTPLVHGLTIRVQDLGTLQMAVLVGDYNENGIVDAGDEVVRKKNEGTNNPLPNDPIGGTIGMAQFDQWKANFGNVMANLQIPAVHFASALNKANYQLTGDFTGNAAIAKVEVVLGSVIVGQPATADIRLVFAKPLADDRYTLTVLEAVKDSGLKKLDGESDADEPLDPTFPTGDGTEGGNFVARFTLDSRPEIGSWINKNINIDTNGNKMWDPDAPMGGDATNLDLSFSLPVQNANGSVAPGGFLPLDQLFAGQFVRSPEAFPPSRFFDQLGAYGNSTELGGYRWIVDTNGDGVVTLGTDVLTKQPPLPASRNFSITSAYPIAGDFSQFNPGDEIGLYTAGKWAFDTNFNFVIDNNDLFITGTLLGYRVVGDFDGDARDDLAVFNNDTWYFDLAHDGLGITNSAGAMQADADGNDRDATLVWGFPGPMEKPLAADMDQDGIDDIGLWNPSSTAGPPGTAEWQFLVSGALTATVSQATSPTQFAASGLIGAMASANQIIRVMSFDDFKDVGVIQNFNSTTGAVTLVEPISPLFGGPFVGDIVSIGGVPGTIVKLSHGFSPAPLGNDFRAFFGSQSWLPIVGNFDPPVTASAAGGGASGGGASAASVFSPSDEEPAVDGAEVSVDVVHESGHMAGSVADMRVRRDAVSSLKVLSDTLVIDAVMADLRLLLLSRGAKRDVIDTSRPLEPDTRDGARGEDVELDLALEVAWDELD
jgi:hypothetical protein